MISFLDSLTWGGGEEGAQGQQQQQQQQQQQGQPSEGEVQMV